jgi:hypothetical protein
MNRLDASPYCRCCGMDLRARLANTDLVRLRAEFARMIANGMCDNCQSDRLEAALEYEAAVNEVSLVTYLGGGWTRDRPPRLHPALSQAKRRLNAADARCVRLRMWPEWSRREETK